MKILLDTHTFIWWILDHERLSNAARQTLESASNEFLLSAASTWEMSIKVGLGKLRLPTDVGGFVRTHMKTNRIDALAITIDHSFGVASLPKHHVDPFDRLLVAQAVAENLPIVTNDDMLKRYGVRIIW